MVKLMYSKYLIGLLFSLLSLVSIDLNGQRLSKFSTDPEKFIEELDGFFSESNKDFSEQIMSEFRLIWDLGAMDPKKQEKLINKANQSLEARLKKVNADFAFRYDFTTKRLGPQQMAEVMLICNQMLSKRMKAIPDFESYIYALLSFMISQQEESSFNAWSKSCLKLVKQNRRNYSSYIKKCNDLFLLNAIQESPNTKWKARNYKYHFDYDSLPKVSFESLDLICYAKNDSAVVYNTSGTYYPTRSKFYGKKGTVYWDRADVGRDTSYAKLSLYSVSLNRPEFNADSVIYYNKTYFKGALLGSLREKVLANASGPKARYPRFESYDKKVFLKNLFPSIDYEGGFGVQGARFVGAGSEEELASVYIKKKDTVKMRADARAFVVREDRIQSSITGVTIYLETDSIFHPAVSFKFLNEKRELTLLRTEKGISASPFFNSYHKLDMYFEWLKWIIDTDKMEMSAIVGTDVGKGYFESTNYYDEGKFLELQGISDVHPLIRVRNFVNDQNYGDREFTDVDFQRAVNLSKDQTQRLLIRMNNLGFVIYDITNGKVRVNDRAFEYILAKSAKTDYDQLMFASKVKNHSNAELSLLNNALTVYGVKKVLLSDTQKVYLHPIGQTVTIFKNRDFSCGGVVDAGKTQYFTRTIRFTYDQFKIDMASIDSLRFGGRHLEENKLGKRVFEKKPDGRPKYGLVKNVLEDLIGTLYIDYAYNKSGLKKDSFPDYPKFTADNKSYVYYDSRRIQKGVYDRSKFYFQVNEFTMDSLNTFDERTFGLTGTFTSGIFPEFDESLTIMDDHSLGFKRKAPEGGYDLYGKRGKFINDIKLSSKGLQGDGTLEYLTSTTVSDEFSFYPDSVHANASSYDIKPVVKGQGTEYPSAEAINVYMHWEPNNDRMTVKSNKSPFSMYDKNVELKGTLFLSSSMLESKGLMSFEEAELNSNRFTCLNQEMKADTSDFRLKTDDTEAQGEAAGLAFKTNNVNTYINFEERMGEFIANDGASYVDFPVNEYICYMDKFKWFMDKAELELSSTGRDKVAASGANDDLDLSGSEFISTHTDQDSLRFISPAANYDLKNYVIKAHKVQYINVADAKIYPDSGEVVIQKKAKMETLRNAKILANTTTKFHELINATVSVHARRDYDAEADYEYVDKRGKRQLIRFNEISVDTVYQTVGMTEVKEKQGFTLSDAFSYKGVVNLMANEKFLKFRGHAQLNHTCDISKPWVNFEDFIDSKNVMIPVDSNVVDEKEVKLANGFMLKRDSVHIYSSFVSYRKYHSDRYISPASGYMMYNAINKEYKISNKDKLRESSFPGNMVTLNTSNCEMSVEGKFKIDEKLGQVKLETYGTGVQNTINSETEFHVMMAFDFLLDNNLWKEMSTNMIGNPNLVKVDLSSAHYKKVMTESLGKEESDKASADISLYGAFKKFPDKFSEHAFVMSDVTLLWDQESRSYRSSGAIGIQNIGKKDIHKYVTGNIEIQKKKSGDVLTMYFEIDDKTWFFFTYRNGVMQVLSSVEDFNNTVTALKSDDRSNKGAKGEGPYSYMLSTKAKKQRFLSKVK